VEGKIKSGAELKGIVGKGKAEGLSFVFTNGCFDLLHPGHLHLLGEAKKHGDLLIVAINSDRSVRRIKGDERPILPESARAALVASLEMVDYVTVFDEVDPLSLIQDLEPDILVKGGDWKMEEVVGRALVKKVVLVPHKEGYSTTNLVKKILESRAG
jgi:D-beta-D-heptose 7-phosphate kinase/D-beta-D-heptose 1-phosphate adenosyltransferase